MNYRDQVSVCTMSTNNKLVENLKQLFFKLKPMSTKLSENHSNWINKKTPYKNY